LLRKRRMASCNKDKKQKLFHKSALIGFTEDLNGPLISK